MLFIDDHETEVLEDRVLLDESVRADNDLDLAGGNLFQQLLLLRLLDPAADDSDSITQWSQNPLCIEEMLFGQDLCRSHQRSLILIRDGDHNGLEGYNGLAASDIALQEAHHRVRGF